MDRHKQKRGVISASCSGGEVKERLQRSASSPRQYFAGLLLALSAFPSRLDPQVSALSRFFKIVILCILFLLAGKSAFATELITNGSFETVGSGWTLLTNGSNQTDSWWNINNPSGAYAGNRYQYIGAQEDGVSAANNVNGLIYQTVTIPAGTTSVTLSYYVKITTSESLTAAYDNLYVEIQNSSGSVLATPLSYSNQSASQFSSWTQQTVNLGSYINLSSYAGQALRVAFHGTTDNATITVFRIDDVSMQATGGAVADSTPPTISAFSVTPSSLTVGSPFTISYTVSDTGGSGLWQMQLWRTTDNNGVPDSSNWTKVTVDSLSGNGPVSGSFTDAPTSAGTYWYGGHGVDNAINIGYEPSGAKVVVNASTSGAVATPFFSTASGTYGSVVFVDITTATNGATIRYTTDGSDPTSSSTLYASGSVSIKSTTTLKARAFKSGMTDSAVASASYTITAPYTLIVTVTRSDNGAPLPDASVTLDGPYGAPPQIIQNTLLDGRTTFNGLTGGLYWITVTKSGYQTTGSAAGAGGSSPSQENISLTPDSSDTTPDAFSFTDQTGVALSTQITSNSITVSGVNTATGIAVVGGEYSINGGGFTSGSGTLNNSDTVQVRHTSAATYSTATNTVLAIGGVSDTFTSTTLAAPASTYTVGGTISGLTGIVVLRNNGGADLSRSANGGFTFSTALANGASYSVTVATQPSGQTCTVSNGSGTIASTNAANVAVNCASTVDTTPDAFSFTDQTGVALSTQITSNSITVSGINAAAAISVSGGDYSINGGSFTNGGGSVTNGNTVRVRHTSASTYSTAKNTTLTIGGVSDTFTSTTLADPNTPPGAFTLNPATPFCSGNAPAVSLFWGPSNAAASYELYRNDKQHATGIKQITYTDSTSVAPGTSYSYYVVAKNAAGTASAKSNTVTASVPGNVCPTSNTGGMLVSVTDKLNGTLLSGATVSLSGPAIPSPQPTVDGLTTFTGLAAGSYTVSASRSGYLSSSRSATVTANSTAAVGVNLQPDSSANSVDLKRVGTTNQAILMTSPQPGVTTNPFRVKISNLTGTWYMLRVDPQSSVLDSETPRIFILEPYGDKEFNARLNPGQTLGWRAMSAKGSSPLDPDGEFGLAASGLFALDFNARLLLKKEFVELIQLADFFSPTNFSAKFETVKLLAKAVSADTIEYLSEVQSELYSSNPSSRKIANATAIYLTNLLENWVNANIEKFVADLFGENIASKVPEAIGSVTGLFSIIPHVIEVWPLLQRLLVATFNAPLDDYVKLSAQ